MDILVFNLLQEELGIEVSCVCEVLRPQQIHPLPRTPEFIEGVINLRGHIIAVMDLRKKFGLKMAPDQSNIRIIVCKIKKMIVGIIVDSVSEVLTVTQESIEPAPGIISLQIEDNYISGIARVAERVIVILNLEKILTKEDISRLSQIKR